jgi:cytochrome bd-type quinol oxidase subunit 2
MESNAGSGVSARSVSARPAGCLHVAVTWLLGIGELLTLACCLLAMYLGMKTNGQVFTETIEKTRRATWDIASGVGLTVSCVALVYFIFRYVVTRKGILVLLAQVVVMALAIVIVVSFHGAIPVPPGTQTTGIPGP